METVRFINLEQSTGELIMDLEDESSILKMAIFYLEQKTSHLSDEEFIEYLKKKMNKTPHDTYGEMIEFDEDIYGKYSFLSKHKLELQGTIQYILGLAIDANNLHSVRTGHIIPYEE